MYHQKQKSQLMIGFLVLCSNKSSPWATHLAGDARAPNAVGLTCSVKIHGHPAAGIPYKRRRTFTDICKIGKPNSIITNYNYLNRGTIFQMTWNKDSGEIALLPPWFKLIRTFLNSSAIRASDISASLRDCSIPRPDLALSSKAGRCLK